MVEDDADVREALAALLDHAGYEVIEAAHGGEALRVLADRSVCMILLDLFMPEVNGWAFRGEQLKNPRLAAIPVLVITADTTAATHPRTPGVVATMTKPVDFDRLLDVVRRYC